MADCVTLGSRLTSFRKPQVRLKSPNNFIWTVRSGQVAKIEWFFDHAKALEAVGLSE